MRLMDRHVRAVGCRHDDDDDDWTRLHTTYSLFYNTLTLLRTYFNRATVLLFFLSKMVLPC